MQILDPCFLVDNVDGDGELLAEIVSVFFDSSAELLEAMRGAVLRANPDAISRSAHQLKGALANVGAEAAAHAAGELETLGRRGSMTGLEDAMFTLEHELGRLRPELEQLARSGAR